MTCPNCGKNLQSDMSFCPYCGNEIKQKDNLENDQIKDEQELSSAVNPASQQKNNGENNRSVSLEKYLIYGAVGAGLLALITYLVEAYLLAAFFMVVACACVIGLIIKNLVDGNRRMKELDQNNNTKVKENNHTTTKTLPAKTQIKEYYTSNKLNPQIEYSVGGPSGQNCAYSYCVDEENKKIILIKDASCNGKVDIQTVSFEDLIGFDSAPNYVKSSPVKRAIVGGALAGDVGAVVGATTKSNKIISYELNFHTKIISNPCITMNIYHHEIDPGCNQLTLNQLKSFVQKVENSMRAILHTNENN